MSIKENLLQIKSQIPNHVTLVAVSKTKPVSDLMEAYNAGQRIFGENKIQEMTDKWEEMPKDIQWHMIGHVQTNKVKFMAEYVSLIHGVDSLKLLQEINKQAQKYNRVIECLLQIYIAEEESKFGLDEEELSEILNSDELKSMNNIKIVGLMGMATFTDNQNQIKKEFDNLKNIFDKEYVIYDGSPSSALTSASGTYNVKYYQINTPRELGFRANYF
ncbi:MAG: YggS family pyridoxal phosphate-dependent enzyme, partial [Flavobacteriaceae bacterium]|nr:YggS family pyridoxal phosphate-dependent enzyme [Flavobacteriaceae bacterium]